MGRNMCDVAQGMFTAMLYRTAVLLHLMYMLYA